MQTGKRKRDEIFAILTPAKNKRARPADGIVPMSSETATAETSLTLQRNSQDDAPPAKKQRTSPVDPPGTSAVAQVFETRTPSLQTLPSVTTDCVDTLFAPAPSPGNSYIQDLDHGLKEAVHHSGQTQP